MSGEPSNPGSHHQPPAGQGRDCAGRRDFDRASPEPHSASGGPYGLCLRVTGQLSVVFAHALTPVGLPGDCRASGRKPVLFQVGGRHAQVSECGAWSPQADDGAGQFEKALVEAVAYPVADAQAFELVEPGETPLHHPTGSAQAGAGWGTPVATGPCGPTGHRAQDHCSWPEACQKALHSGSCDETQVALRSVLISPRRDHVTGPKPLLHGLGLWARGSVASGHGASAKLVGGPRRPLLVFRRPCDRTRRWYP